MDVNRLRALGWQARMGLETGVMQAYQDYVSTLGNKSYHESA